MVDLSNYTRSIPLSLHSGLQESSLDGKKKVLEKSHTLQVKKKKSANLLNNLKPLQPPPHTGEKLYDCYCMLLMALKSKFTRKEKNFLALVLSVGIS